MLQSLALHLAVVIGSCRHVALCRQQVDVYVGVCICVCVTVARRVRMCGGVLVHMSNCSCTECYVLSYRPVIFLFGSDHVETAFTHVDQLQRLNPMTRMSTCCATLFDTLKSITLLQ